MIDYLLFTFRPICGLLSDEVKRRPLVKSTLFMERWKAQGWGTGSMQLAWDHNVNSSNLGMPERNQRRARKRSRKEQREMKLSTV